MIGERAPAFFGWPGWAHVRLALGVSAVGMIWFLLVYGGADWITSHRSSRISVHTTAELGWPFVPEAVLVYISCYALFALAPFVLRRRREFLALAWSLNGTIFAAGIIFLLVPAQLAFPPPTDLGFFPRLFQWADEINLTYNLLPSLHVALSVVCVAAFAPQANRGGRVVLWSWAAAIAFSTVLTRQHHLADVVAGAALGFTAHRLIYRRSLGGASPV
jgi:membrane-associated phospholipid phosphatase